MYIVMEECRGGDLEQLMEVRTSTVHDCNRVVKANGIHTCDAPMWSSGTGCPRADADRFSNATLVLCLYFGSALI